MSLGSIVNSKKLFIKKEHTELVDELFQFPKGRHDDLLDGLYYADFYAKPPRSKSMNLESINENDFIGQTRKQINWVTGLKI